MQPYETHYKPGDKVFVMTALEEVMAIAPHLPAGNYGTILHDTTQYDQRHGHLYTVRLNSGDILTAYEDTIMDARAHQRLDFTGLVAFAAIALIAIMLVTL